MIQIVKAVTEEDERIGVAHLHSQVYLDQKVPSATIVQKGRNLLLCLLNLIVEVDTVKKLREKFKKNIEKLTLVQKEIDEAHPGI